MSFSDFCLRLSSRKPLGVLIALAAEVGHVLATEEGEAALHAAAHRPEGEVAPG